MPPAVPLRPFRVDYTDGAVPAKDLWDNSTYDAYQFSARAVRLVEEHDVTKPFFLYWAPHKVHAPLQASAEFLQAYPMDDKKLCQSTPSGCSQRGWNAACGCEGMCYCNRRLIRGMVRTHLPPPPSLSRARSLDSRTPIAGLFFSASYVDVRNSYAVVHQRSRQWTACWPTSLMR